LLSRSKVEEWVGREIRFNDIEFVAMVRIGSDRPSIHPRARLAWTAMVRPASVLEDSLDPACASLAHRLDGRRILITHLLGSQSQWVLGLLLLAMSPHHHIIGIALFFLFDARPN